MNGDSTIAFSIQVHCVAYSNELDYWSFWNSNERHGNWNKQKKKMHALIFHQKKVSEKASDMDICNTSLSVMTSAKWNATLVVFRIEWLIGPIKLSKLAFIIFCMVLTLIRLLNNSTFFVSLKIVTNEFLKHKDQLR